MRKTNRRDSFGPREYPTRERLCTCRNCQGMSGKALLSACHELAGTGPSAARARPLEVEDQSPRTVLAMMFFCTSRLPPNTEAARLLI